MIKVLLTVTLIPLTFGVVAGLISAYRAGQKPHRPVFLRIKKFAHRIFNEHTHRHLRLHWQWYLLITGFILVALGH